MPRNAQDSRNDFEQNKRDQELVKRLFALTTDFPIEFKQWLTKYMEASPPNLLYGSLGGIDPPIVTSLPTVSQTTEVYYQANSTDGVVWRLRYNPNSSSSYKWEFIGGAPLRDSEASTETTFSAASPTWVNAPTNQLGVTVPLAGDYAAFCQVQFQADGSGGTSAFGVATGAAATPSSPNVGAVTVAASGYATLSIDSIHTGVAASTELRQRYQVAGTGWSISHRLMYVRPIRVG